MRNWVVLLLFISSQSFGFESPFKSTVKGLDIPNAHVVSKGDEKRGELIRSQAPRPNRSSSPEGPKDYPQIAEYGITDVLIFKNQTKTEVDEELELLTLLNPAIETDHIDFLWRNHQSFKAACNETIDALIILKKVFLNPKKKLLFHCTVGEDRTGHLAALWRLLVDKWSVRKAFDEEMCRNGYEAGNPEKEEFVVNAIRSSLTKVFLKMAYKIERGYITFDNLDSLQSEDEEGVTECDRDPGNSKTFANNTKYRSKDYFCAQSPLYPIE